MYSREANPPLLGIRTSEDALRAFSEYFEQRTMHTCDDGLDAATLILADMGGSSDNLADIAFAANTILTACREMHADLLLFHAWKGEHLLVENRARLLRGKGKPTPVTWWPVAFGCWCLMPINEQHANGAADAVRAFRSKVIPLEVAIAIVRAFLGQPPEAQAIFVELLQNQALLADDLRSPADALAILADPGFTAVLNRWRTNGRQPKLRAVAAQILREERRLTKRFAPKREPIPIVPSIPAPARSEKEQPIAPSEPLSLCDVLEVHLPARARPMAENVAVALSVMKMERKPWTIQAIVTRVRNIMGTAVLIAQRLIEDAFRWLSKRGVVKSTDGYQLNDTTDDTLGQRILGLVQ